MYTLNIQNKSIPLKQNKSPQLLSNELLKQISGGTGCALQFPKPTKIKRPWFNIVYNNNHSMM